MVTWKQGRMKRQGSWIWLLLTFLLVSSLLRFSPCTLASAAGAADAPAPAVATKPAAPKPAPKPSPVIGAPVDAPPPKPSKALPPASPPPHPPTAAPPKAAPKAPSLPPAASKTKPSAPSNSPVSPPVPSPVPPMPSGSPASSPSPTPKAAPTGKAKPAASPSHPPKEAPPKKAPRSPTPSVADSPADAPESGPSALNTKQLAALKALHVSFTASDPCNSPGHDILCNKAGKTIMALTVRNCSKSMELTQTTLADLAGVQKLDFVDCPVQPPSHVPKALVKTLTSLYLTASLGRTGINEKIPRLKGQWLSQLVNLEEIFVTEVDVSSNGLFPIVQSLPAVVNLTISGAGIGGLLPKRTWPEGLQYIDVSHNQIHGTIPSQMRYLAQLTYLDLSQNQLKGVIPTDIFNSLTHLQHVDLSGNELSGPIPGSIAQLHNCSHLDLSNNKLNGSIPANLTSLKALKYLDLSQNQFTGEIKFNSSFLKKLKMLKIAPNPSLCYNHTAIKSKFLAGIQNCVPPTDDSLFAPAPAPSTLEDLNARSGGGGGISKGAAAGISIVVIVAAAVMFVVGRKLWKARQRRDEFISMRP